MAPCSNLLPSQDPICATSRQTNIFLVEARLSRASGANLSKRDAPLPALSRFERQPVLTHQCSVQHSLQLTSGILMLEASSNFNLLPTCDFLDVHVVRSTAQQKATVARASLREAARDCAPEM
eukprot:TRINITY_DN4506_c0_g1_i2.p1 TRINITY_DN4506_c0_g1~~TRINITY_DN4506_c0_g1_i2.p1  ORF type:complete len:123 (-),score=13.40 TRINITY_DN4506_c0_g1_i2:56-424(-)